MLLEYVGLGVVLPSLWLSSFFSCVSGLLGWCVVYVESYMKGWCEELMKTLGGPSCRGMHIMKFKAFCNVGDFLNIAKSTLMIMGC